MLRKPLGAAKCSSFRRRFARLRTVSVNPVVPDLTILLQADCDDNTLSSPALTTSAELVQRSPEALLNHANRPLLVPLLLLLHRRGALQDGRTRQEIARFLVPSVHRDRLPWLWDDGAGTAAPSGNISALRSLPPFLWRAVIERGKPAEPSEQLHYWHQVLFALSANPAFSEAETLDGAHRELLALIHDYYTDVMHVQQFFPPLNGGVIVTRMPPVLVRKLRKLYVDQYRLLQYAELFRAIVDGEELVMSADGTALLNDVEVFEYYITIPGRRESGLKRDGRWAYTLEYAAFAFQKLFRQQRWKGTAVGTAVARPATLFMNVCVFAKNDNAEGERYREAILAVMRVFHVEFGSDGGTVVNNDTVWDVLRVLRDAGVESMLTKCKRLHFGPMSGLLDVCTVAVVTEILLCLREDATDKKDQTGFCCDELEILLSPRKLIGCEMYEAAQSHSHHHFAACYGLLNLGTRIGAALRTVMQSAASMQRYTKELTKWGALIGRPLRLSLSDVSSLQLSPSLLSEHLYENPAPSWRCGCQTVNLVKTGHVACIGCVSRTLVEHVWTCPHCLWVSASGDRMDTCLGCGRSHPCGVLAKDDDVVVAMSDVPATPFLWYCEGCSSFSPLGSDVVTGIETCVDCGLVGRGWSTGFFMWQCGCGEMNSPLRWWCGACSFRQKCACCSCVRCGREWKLQSFRGVAGGRDVICSSCKEIHPRHAAAWRRRLLRCPFCHWLTSSDVEACQNCGQPRAVLSQFLARLTDWPWLCHTCGHRHCHRDPEGALYPPSTDAVEACGKCGTLRLDPVRFDMHETWLCAECGGQEARGFNCQRCLGLHPAIPAAEVHTWRCVACMSVNNSWDSVCQRRGCRTRRSVDSTALPYAPWRCCRCREFSRSAQVPQCEHCGAVRVVVAATAASYPVVEGTADERRMRRLAEVEAVLIKAASASDGDDDNVLDLNLGTTPADDWVRCVADSLNLAVPLG